MLVKDNYDCMKLSSLVFLCM